MIKILAYSLFTYLVGVLPQFALAMEEDKEFLCSQQSLKRRVRDFSSTSAKYQRGENGAVLEGGMQPEKEKIITILNLPMEILHPIVGALPMECWQPFHLTCQTFSLICNDPLGPIRTQPLYKFMVSYRKFKEEFLKNTRDDGRAISEAKRSFLFNPIFKKYGLLLAQMRNIVAELEYNCRGDEVLWRSLIGTLLRKIFLTPCIIQVLCAVKDNHFKNAEDLERKEDKEKLLKDLMTIGGENAAPETSIDFIISQLEEHLSLPIHFRELVAASIKDKNSSFESSSDSPQNIWILLGCLQSFCDVVNIRSWMFSSPLDPHWSFYYGLNRVLSVSQLVSCLADTSSILYPKYDFFRFFRHLSGDDVYKNELREQSMDDEEYACVQYAIYWMNSKERYMLLAMLYCYVGYERFLIDNDAFEKENIPPNLSCENFTIMTSVLKSCPWDTKNLLLARDSYFAMYMTGLMRLLDLNMNSPENDLKFIEKYFNKALGFTRRLDFRGVFNTQASLNYNSTINPQDIKAVCAPAELHYGLGYCAGLKSEKESALDHFKEAIFLRSSSFPRAYAYLIKHSLIGEVADPMNILEYVELLLTKVERRQIDIFFKAFNIKEFNLVKKVCETNGLSKDHLLFMGEWEQSMVKEWGEIPTDAAAIFSSIFPNNEYIEDDYPQLTELGEDEGE